MKKLLETMYVLTPESYVFHRNENVCISIGGEEKASVPVTSVNSIVFFGKNTLSTSLLGFCAKNDVTITFVDAFGHFEGRLCGPVSGNVLLRKRQYESLSDSAFCRQFVGDLLAGKLYNSKNILMRHARGSKEEEPRQYLYQGAEQIAELAGLLEQCADCDGLRGIEGSAAKVYFSRFDSMLSSPSGFRFDKRSRRPPLNEVNAVLSFLYTQLTHDMVSAMETVGLDPAAGYLHTLRPGRPSFALDLMEEFRAPLCDRLALTLFNRGQLAKPDFRTEGDAIYLNDKGRRTVLAAWRERKKEDIQHPFLKESIPIGLIPYTQAMLFARVLRGDLDRYPPFMWR